MKQVCQVSKLKSAADLSKFTTLYTKMGDDVKAELHKHGCTNYTIGHHNGVVFTYFEYSGANLKTDLKGFSESACGKKWEAQFVPILEGKWYTLDTVFHMD